MHIFMSDAEISPERKSVESSVSQTQWQRRIPDHSITWSTNVELKESPHRLKKYCLCGLSYYPGENPQILKKKVRERKSVNSAVPRNKRQSRG